PTCLLLREGQALLPVVAARHGLRHTAGMTQHASSLPPSTAPEPTHAERVRTLLESERIGTLATQSLRNPGFPFASVMPSALTVAHVYFFGGVGVMGWVAAADYTAAEADPLADAAAGILEHMNGDHADAVRAISRHFGGLDAEEATIVACDRLGFVVRARTAEGMKGMRIAFPEPVRTRDEARTAFVPM